jgi:WD40 repeat protein
MSFRIDTMLRQCTRMEQDTMSGYELEFDLIRMVSRGHKKIKFSLMTVTSLLFGTYEGGVVGFDFTVGTDGQVDTEQFMSAPCHIGCVRSAASCGRFAATGGTDEVIQVFDVIKRRQMGNMGGSVHTATISALAVCQKPDLLVSGGEDGQIAITRIKTFQTLRSFQGHKGSVSDIAIHPSGKIALSVSLDNTLRMWDLTRGTCAAVRNITPAPKSRGPVVTTTAQMQLRYTPEGSRYALLLADGSVEICSSSSMDVCRYEGPVNSVAALSEDVFVVGNAKGELTIIEVVGESVEPVVSISDLHTARLRGIARIAPADKALYVASVCSKGTIVISRYDTIERSVKQVKSVETGERITCFTTNS